MIIEQLVVGNLGTNCYVLGDEATHEAIVIDPGGDAERILDILQRLKLTLKLVVNTHSHFDHVLANREILEATGAPLAIHADDAPSLMHPPRIFQFLVGNLPSSPAPTQLLQEGDILSVGTCTLRVLHTPGHSPGSISLWCPEHKVVFDGDALFNQGIGRTDFPGGSFEVLEQSIRTKLFTLPADTVVYSGHGPSTTIGFERAHNPFVSESRS